MIKDSQVIQDIYDSQDVIIDNLEIDISNLVSWIALGIIIVLVAKYFFQRSSMVEANRQQDIIDEMSKPTIYHLKTTKELKARLKELKGVDKLAEEQAIIEKELYNRTPEARDYYSKMFKL